MSRSTLHPARLRQDAREALCHTARALGGITPGTSGNLSFRLPTGFLVSPSGVPYEDLTPDSFPEASLCAQSEEDFTGALLPSSEWRFHRDILRFRNNVNAVVHAHPTFATALALCGRELPASHYAIAALGGPVRVARYATYGTEELSGNVLEALGDRHACLLANHGALTVGKTLPEALSRLRELEELCRQFHAAQAFGEPQILSDEEIAHVAKKLAKYGQKSA